MTSNTDPQDKQPQEPTDQKESTEPPEQTEAEKSKNKDLKIRQIRRRVVYTGLYAAGILAVALSVYYCDRATDYISEEEAGEPMQAVFYQNAAQCQADTTKQQEEYAAAQVKYQNGQLSTPPNPPAISPKDCEAQMLAAEQEHQKTAPVYNTISDCQADGVQCEPTATGEPVAGYRPAYGGTYLNTTDPTYTYINYGGYQHRIYQNSTVYRSINSGKVVTPHGREISQTTTGRVTVPRHATLAAPARPAGTAAKGTIRGRSSQGFGSSFKSTGRGGK